jgi:hypothetical protein
MRLSGQLLGGERRLASRASLVLLLSYLRPDEILASRFMLLSPTLPAHKVVVPLPAPPVKYCLLNTVGTSFYVSSGRLAYGQNQRQKRVVKEARA